ncbi:MAG: Stp1/IreP family PP2C-type Ser/Thr phosphatase [Deltaproteobacteria bacterium]|jgi:protein phosphatase
MLFFGKTDVGLKRAKNEDSFVVKPGLGLCLVADGMGGAAAGELASRIFVETAVEVFSGSLIRAEDDTADLVQRAFEGANEGVLDHVRLEPRHKGMGCTAELMAFCNDTFVLGHVGDSRTYLLRNAQLKQLTEDHSVVQDQVNRGIISAAEAKHHPLRSVILRAVGVKEKIDVDLIRGKALPGDLFLLCSDGLTDLVDDTLIQEALSLNGAIHERADKLIDLAKSAGGHDNITVVLCVVT